MNTDKNPLVQIPLSKAKLCVDLNCNTIFTWRQTCPVCCSSEWHWLSKILNREEKPHDRRTEE